jgi:hypothetical protein
MSVFMLRSKRKRKGSIVDELTCHIAFTVRVVQYGGKGLPKNITYTSGLLIDIRLPIGCGNPESRKSDILVGKQ